MRRTVPAPLRPAELSPPRYAGWPIAIAVWLGIVVIVNFAFAYVAVSGADAVSPSYARERR
jgi:hypothetical protein